MKTWQLKSFAQLTTEELYQLLHLRTAVFVVEQNCAYQELDKKDQLAQHLWLAEDGEISAYCRLFAKGTSFDDAASIGRVLVAPALRGTGCGKVLLQKAIETLRQNNEKKIKIEAQTYAQAFYQQSGFQTISAPFLEDGIEHALMELNLEK